MTASHATEHGAEFQWPVFLKVNSLAVLGFLALLIPTVYDLSKTLWQISEQEHGPIIFGIILWLFWQSKNRWVVADSLGSSIGWFPIVFSLLMYVFGRSQEIFLFEIGSLITLVGGLAILYRGFRGLKAIWFPLFFALFLIPLPGAVVDALTSGLKSNVSLIAEWVLYHLNYPVARSGVLITVGQYQLLVADACSGMHSMFSLFAMGTLYLHLQAYSSVKRNIVLFLLIAPIAFFANIIRVMILILVTFHFGDAAGQGFIHDMAGFVLFGVALMTLFITDQLYGFLFARKNMKNGEKHED